MKRHSGWLMCISLLVVVAIVSLATAEPVCHIALRRILATPGRVVS